MSEERDDDHESYQDRRAREYEEAAARHKERLKPDHVETEDEFAEVLNRDDEVLDSVETWGEVFHDVTIRFRWSEISRYTEGLMESIEMVDGDPIGAAIDASLEPHYDTDVFEVVEISHRVEYEDRD